MCSQKEMVLQNTKNRQQNYIATHAVNVPGTWIGNPTSYDNDQVFMCVFALFLLFFSPFSPIAPIFLSPSSCFPSCSKTIIFSEHQEKRNSHCQVYCISGSTKNNLNTKERCNSKCPTSCHSCFSTTKTCVEDKVDKCNKNITACPMELISESNTF